MVCWRAKSCSEACSWVDGKWCGIVEDACAAARFLLIRGARCDVLLHSCLLQWVGVNPTLSERLPGLAEWIASPERPFESLQKKYQVPASWPFISSIYLCWYCGNFQCCHAERHLTARWFFWSRIFPAMVLSRGLVKGIDSVDGVWLCGK